MYCSCVKCDPFARSSSPCTAKDFVEEIIEEIIEDEDEDYTDYPAGSIHPAYYMDNDYDPFDKRLDDYLWGHSTQKNDVSISTVIHTPNPNPLGGYEYDDELPF